MIFGRRDGLGSLCMGADDERRRHGIQAPARGNAFDLLRGIPAVAPRADHDRIGPAVQALERRIVHPVEEVLHLP
jgi:hypothetical protein